MPRQDPGEPYFRVDSAEGQALIAADPDGSVVIDVRHDARWLPQWVTNQTIFTT